MSEQIDVEEILETFYQYIEKVQIGSIFIANNFREKKIKSALESVLDFSEGMDWLVAANKYFLLNSIETNFEESVVQGFLEEINQALMVEDYFLVADLFEYEVVEYFKSIKVN